MNNGIKRVSSPVSGLVDDMLNQLDPDPVKIGENCHHCKKSIVTSDDYTSDDDNIYCSENCYWDFQELIPNTTEALREYCSQLVDEIMAMPIQDAQETPSIIGQYHDVADELYRRDMANIQIFDLDNAILSDMTSAVLTAQKLASLEETQELPAIDETSF